MQFDTYKCLVCLGRLFYSYKHTSVEKNSVCIFIITVVESQ